MSSKFNFGDKWIVDFAQTRLLIKVAKRNRLEELQQGKIYMKPVKFHRENEKNFPGLGVGDAGEGVMTKFENADILIDGKVVGQAVNGTICANNLNPVFCCMSVNFKQISDKKAEFRVDKQMLDDFVQGAPEEFGVLLIEQTPFLKRIGAACEKLGIGCVYRDVIYSDDELLRIKVENGIIMPPAFFKSTRFAYQHEFRILFLNQIEDHFILDIGDISDISRVYPVGLLKYGIDLEVKDV